MTLRVCTRLHSQTKQKEKGQGKEDSEGNAIFNKSVTIYVNYRVISLRFKTKHQMTLRVYTMQHCQLKPMPYLGNRQFNYYSNILLAPTEHVYLQIVEYIQIRHENGTCRVVSETESTLIMFFHYPVPRASGFKMSLDHFFHQFSITPSCKHTILWNYF